MRFPKKLLFILVVLLMGFTLAGCRGRAEETAEPEEMAEEGAAEEVEMAEEGFDVVFLPKFLGIAVFDEAFAGAQEAAEELGTADGLELQGPTPENSVEGQIEIITSATTQGVDAILISSAFAGAGLISRDDYETFVLPYEARVIDEIHRDYPDVPVYTHTCGAIGDRLDLMLQTGSQGIDTLDPPPLGTVELEEAVAVLKGKAFSARGYLPTTSPAFDPNIKKYDFNRFKDELKQIVGKIKNEL